MTVITEKRTARRLQITVVAAFAAIYVLWGSTYIAIRIAVATVPPLFAAGVRFTIAGVILYGWYRSKGEPAPSGMEWRSLWLLGALMFLGAYSGLFWAEKSLPSGIASVLVATIPVWIVVLETFVLRTQRLRWATAFAVLLGLGGVAVIAMGQQDGGRAVNIAACLAILGAEICWSVGTVVSKLIRLPKSVGLSSGAQMLCGGLLLLVCSLLAGELRPLPQVSGKAALAVGYLIVAGSLIGFTAYMWLLGRASSTKVTSYAYVNPVVALAIGYWLGGETLRASTLAGSALVLLSVVLILAGGELRHEPEKT